MKKYFLAFLITFIFSSFALAEDESKLIVEESNTTIDFTNNANNFEYPPDIDELINTLGKKDSFTIIIPKYATYSNNGIVNHSKTRIISKTELNDKIKLEIDSSRTFQNYLEPTIYNELFRTEYNNYSTSYAYSSGYIVSALLKINFDKKSNLEVQEEFYWEKIPELLIKKGFEKTCIFDFWNCSKYKKGDILAELSPHGNVYSGKYFDITFTNEKLIKEAEKNINNKNNFDSKNANNELERIFR